MEKSEQHVVIKFLWMKGREARRVHIKLSRVLSIHCSGSAVIERWLARFRQGDLSCVDHSRSGRSVIDISECLRAFLGKFPFASANTIFKHFRRAHGTIMEILQRDIWLEKLSRRWMPHQLSSSQKAGRVFRSRALLHLLRYFDFKGITTGDESSFRHQYEADSMFAPSADMVLSRLRAGFQVKKTMITVLFAATRLIV
jgi:hypothetical protein